MMLPTVLLVSLSLFGPPAPAEAPTGTGSVGSAHAFFESPPLDVRIDPLAQCTVGGVTTATTPGATTPGYASFGGGSTSCAVDGAGTAKVTVSGRRFTFSWLRAHGGPVIKIAGFSATCSTSANRSNAGVRVAGLSGINAPNPIPPDYAVTFPENSPTPLARVVLNERILPTPRDGGMTVNLMHITLFPQSYGFNNGEVVVGSVHCSPRAGA